MSHDVHTGVSVGFDPTVYFATEGVDDTVTLTVVKTGSSDIPVTATVTTLSGSAQSMELWRWYSCLFKCGLLFLFQQMVQTIHTIQ